MTKSSAGLTIALSHAQEVESDRDLAQKLEQALRESRHKIFRASSSLVAADSFPLALLQSLNASHVPIALASHASMRNT